MAFIYRSRVPYFGLWCRCPKKQGTWPFFNVLLKPYYVVYENDKKDKFRFDQTGGAYRFSGYPVEVVPRFLPIGDESGKPG